MKEHWQFIRESYDVWHAVLILAASIFFWLYFRGQVKIRKIIAMKTLEGVLNRVRDKANLAHCGIYVNKFDSNVDEIPLPAKGYSRLVCEQNHPYQKSQNENEYFLGSDAILLIHEAGKHDITHRHLDRFSKPKDDEVDANVMDWVHNVSSHMTLRISTMQKGKEVVTLWCIAAEYSDYGDKYIEYLKYEARKKIATAMNVQYQGKIPITHGPK